MGFRGLTHEDLGRMGGEKGAMGFRGLTHEDLGRMGGE